MGTGTLGCQGPALGCQGRARGQGALGGCLGHPGRVTVTLPTHAARRGADGPPREDPAGAGRVPGPPGVGAGAAAAQRQRGPGERQRLDGYAGTGTRRRAGDTATGAGADGVPCPSAAGGGEHGGPRDGAAGAPVPRLPAGDTAARRHPRAAQQTAPGTAPGWGLGGQRVPPKSLQEPPSPPRPCSVPRDPLLIPAHPTFPGQPDSPPRTPVETPIPVPKASQRSQEGPPPRASPPVPAQLLPDPLISSRHPTSTWR